MVAHGELILVEKEGSTQKEGSEMNLLIFGNLRSGVPPFKIQKLLFPWCDSDKSYNGPNGISLVVNIS